MNSIKSVLEDVYELTGSEVRDDANQVVGWTYTVFEDSNYPSDELFVERSSDEAYLGDEVGMNEPDFTTAEEVRDYLMNKYMEQFAPDTVTETPDEDAARDWVNSTDRFELDGVDIVESE